MLQWASHRRISFRFVPVSIRRSGTHRLSSGNPYCMGCANSQLAKNQAFMRKLPTVPLQNGVSFPLTVRSFCIRTGIPEEVET
jgi:hypothetical protein